MSLKIHPFAESFPMMSELELDRLSASIKDNGLRRPITKRKSDGVIVDGRNRLEACRRAEVAPLFETLDLDEVGSLNLIADLNIERRHMNESQRGIAAAEYAERMVAVRHDSADIKVKPELSPNLGIIPTRQRGPKDKGITEAIKEAANKFNVGRGNVEKARKVLSESPDLAAKVQSGEITLNAAEKRIKSEIPTQKQASRKPKKIIQIDFLPFDAIATELGKIKRRVENLANSSIGIYVNSKAISVDIDNARRSLMFTKPSKKCPHCDGSSQCNSCKGLGWITDAMHMQSQDYKKGKSQ